MGVVLVSVKLEFKMEMMSVIFQLHSFSRLVLLSSCRSQLRL